MNIIRKYIALLENEDEDYDDDMMERSEAEQCERALREFFDAQDYDIKLYIVTEDIKIHGFLKVISKGEEYSEFEAKFHKKIKSIVSRYSFVIDEMDWDEGRNGIHIFSASFSKDNEDGIHDDRVAYMIEYTYDHERDSLEIVMEESGTIEEVKIKKSIWILFNTLLVGSN